MTSASRAGTFRARVAELPPVLTNTLEHNLARVRQGIVDAARSAGRAPEAVELVAVTKTVDAETALALAALGATELGENRVDELERKSALFRSASVPCRWHFVGHVQTNKAARIAACADVVHSVDSVRLVETLDRNASHVGRSLGVYLQVKLHPEANKSGLDPLDLADAVLAVRAASSLRWCGLMTMAPLVADEVRARELADDVFARLATLGREHGSPGLSMGMSDDYALAIQHGSTCVRIGSALFEGLSTRRIGA